MNYLHYVGIDISPVGCLVTIKYQIKKPHLKKLDFLSVRSWEIKQFRLLAISDCQ